jgi:hypothetical protein
LYGFQAQRKSDKPSSILPFPAVYFPIILLFDSLLLSGKERRKEIYLMILPYGVFLVSI